MDSFLHEKVLSLHDDRQKPIAIGHLRLSGDLRREIKKIDVLSLLFKSAAFFNSFKKKQQLILGQLFSF